MLKAARENQFNTYSGSSIKLTADFTSETMKTCKQWHDIFKVLTEDNQPTILYPAKLSFKHAGTQKLKILELPYDKY